MSRLSRMILAWMVGVALTLSLLAASPAKADTPPPGSTASAVPDPAESVEPEANDTPSVLAEEPPADTMGDSSPSPVGPNSTVPEDTASEVPDPAESVVSEEQDTPSAPAEESPVDAEGGSSQSRTAASPSLTVSAATAGTKQVGATTYIWGTATGAPNRPVAVQVIVNGNWSTSQKGTTNSTGYYSLPLTYGSTTPGTYSLRAVVTKSTGGYAMSPTVTLERTPQNVSVSAATAGTKHVGAATNIWGTASGAPNRPVVVQVFVNGNWSTSQKGTTNSSGYYALLLTYGSTTPGRYSFRAVVTTSTGNYAISPTVTLERMPATTALTGFRMALPVQWGATVNVGGTHAFSGTVRSSIDLGASNNVSISVVAAADGVVSVGGANGFSRCYVTVTHSGGWQTKYYHLKGIPSNLRNGSKVVAGQKVGMTGMPGSETCGRGSFRHVHFTLLKNGTEQPLHGVSLGGYTFRNGSGPYCGYTTRDRDGAVVADARRACSAVPKVVNNIVNPSTLAG